MKYYIHAYRRSKILLKYSLYNGYQIKYEILVTVIQSSHDNYLEQSNRLTKESFKVKNPNWEKPEKTSLLLEPSIQDSIHSH